jgi:hypothetical protein
VPHHSTSELHPFFRPYVRSTEICVVDMCDDSLRPIEQLAAAEVVISQGLHGLIYAVSLGKPWVWIANRDDAEWVFKFRDWFTTLRDPPARPTPMGHFDEVLRQARPYESTIDRAALLAAFPTEVIAKRAPPAVGYRTCRAATPVVYFYEGSGAKDAADLPRLLAQLAPINGQMFASWSERPYCVATAIGAGMMPPAPQLAAILRAMDRMHLIEHGFILPISEVEPGEEEPRPIGAGVLFYPGVRQTSGTIVIRPMTEGAVANIGVFGI